MRGAFRGLWLTISCLTALAARPLSAEEPKRDPSDAPAAKAPAAEKPSEAKPAEHKPAADKKTKEPDPFIVPEGTPKELMEYIQKIKKTRVTNMRMAMKAQFALLRAAEHIIAAQPAEAEMTQAVQLKMRLLPTLEYLAEFAAELKENGQEKYSRMVRNYSLRLELAMSEKKGSDARKAAIKKTLDFLAESPPQMDDAGLAMAAGMLAESMEDVKFGSEYYRAAARTFAVCKDEKLAEFARTLEGISRRISLLGGELRIEGKIVGGGDFDWSKYRGKVVLVDFWSTFSGTSVADISKIRKLYDRYHGKGFDIIGINCDQRLADLEKFLKERDIPWAIVYGKDKPSPTVEYYGITDIPTKILVDRDGKVIMLNARGLKLKEELTKIFGPDEERK